MNPNNPQFYPQKSRFNPAKFSHRRINTEFDDPLRKNQHQLSRPLNDPQSPTLEFLKFTKGSPAHKFSKNNLYAFKNQQPNQDSQQIMNTRVGHRRIKTVLDPPQQKQTQTTTQNVYDKRNFFGSFKNIRSDSNLIKEPPKEDKQKKSSKFKKYPLEFCKNQESTAATSTPTGIKSLHSPQYRYIIQGIAGKGTFGVVYSGRVRLTGEKIAIKKVLQDKRYKNRQLEILESLEHENVLKMKDYFFTKQGDQEYLNVIMDHFPDNLYQVIKKQALNAKLIKQFSYKILKGLEYLANNSIAHRDIKPQNILVDLAQNRIVICDFGSAKKLKKGQANISYICSRCYRAPQLIFCAKQYTSQIDVWSFGCVLVQMINGQAPFLGDSQIDQLLQIMKILGTPQKAQIQQMNPQYNLKDYKNFPIIKRIHWHKVLKCSDPLLIDLIKKLLEYSPIKRLSAKQALEHPYFDELRDEDEKQEQQIDLNIQTISIQKKISNIQKIRMPQKISNTNIVQGKKLDNNCNESISEKKQQQVCQSYKMGSKQRSTQVFYSPEIQRISPLSKTMRTMNKLKQNPEPQLSWQRQQYSYKRRQEIKQRAQKLQEDISHKKSEANSFYHKIMKNNTEFEQKKACEGGSAKTGKIGGHYRMRSDIKGSVKQQLNHKDKQIRYQNAFKPFWQKY